MSFFLIGACPVLKIGNTVILLLKFNLFSKGDCTQLKKESVTKMSLKFKMIVINTKDITAVMRTRVRDKDTIY